jgi:hypothetical protein
MSKRCYACGETFPLERFGRDRAKADGHKSMCKACDTARSLDYYYRVKVGSR